MERSTPEIKIERTPSSSSGGSNIGGCARKLRSRKNELGLPQTRSLVHKSSLPDLTQRRQKFPMSWDELKSQVRQWRNSRNDFDSIITCFIGLALALTYFLHLKCHFESLTRFSELSNLERQLSLPNDVALRYSFYKRVAEASSVLQGLRAVTYDEFTNWPHTTNSVHKYSLVPEMGLGVGYHMLKTVEKTLKLKFSKCWQTYRADTDVETGDDILSCIGIGDPMYFYLHVNWMTEACLFALVFYFACFLSDSKLGGLSASILFVFFHPQRSNYEWIFPSEAKTGWFLGTIQIFLTCKLILRPGHSSWRESLAVGVSTCFLLIGWPSEAQWVLTSQLMILVTMHISGLISAYTSSLVIFAHLVGWEYATLATLDFTCVHCSIFLYTLVAAMVTMFIIEPLTDSILIGEKMMLARAGILLVAFPLVMFCVRSDVSGTSSVIREDNRLPLKLGSKHFHPSAFLMEQQMTLSNTPDEISSLGINNNLFTKKKIEPTSPKLLSADESMEVKDEEFNFVSKIDSHHHVPSLPVERHIVITKEETDNFFSDSEKLGNYSSCEQLDEFTFVLQSCLQTHAKFSFHLLLDDYMDLVLVVTYTIILTVVAPICLLLLGLIKEKKALTRLKTPEATGGGETSPESDEKKATNEKLEHPELIYSSEEGSDGKPKYNKSTNSDEDLNYSTGVSFTLIKYHCSPLVFYSGCQLVFFVIFSLTLSKDWEIYIVSQGCLLTSLLWDSQRLSVLKSRVGYGIHYALLTLLLSSLIVTRKNQLEVSSEAAKEQFKIGNPRIEDTIELIKWTGLSTEQNASFLLPEDLIVPVCFVAQRPCFNHILNPTTWSSPFKTKMDFNRNNNTGSHFSYCAYNLTHSEVEERLRTQLYNSIWSREISIDQYHDTLMQRHISYVVVNKESCVSVPELDSEQKDPLDAFVTSGDTRSTGKVFRRKSNPCGVTQLWDVVENFGQADFIKIKEARLCSRLVEKRVVKPFVKVFQNSRFAIFSTQLVSSGKVSRSIKR